MAKNNNSDVIVDNLKGFIRKGAATTPVGYVPTGHFSLDFAINYGELPEKIDLSELEGYDPSNALGIPLGKLVMLYGEEGGGKCVSGDTFIVEKNKGQIKISELFSEFGELKVDTWYSLKIPIEVCINGEYEKVESVYYNGKKKTTKITTSCGYNLEGSYDKHKVLSVCNGNVSWKKLKDLQEGDFVCMSRKSQFPLQSKISTNIASVLGYMIAEGYCGEKRSNMNFTNFDLSVMEDFVYNYKESFGKMPLQSPDRKTEASISVDIVKKLVSLGLERVLSVEKTIPHSILSGNYDVVATFLRSYFEGDGYVSEKNVGCCSKSYNLMHEIQLLLLRFGIVSSVNRKVSKLSYTDKYPNGYESWRLNIDGLNVLKYAEHVGFVSPKKKKSLNVLLKKMINTKRNNNKDVIPKSLAEKIFTRLRSKINELPPTGKRGKYFSRKDYQNWDSGLSAIRPSYLYSVTKGVSRSTIEMCSNSIATAAKEDVLLMIEDEFSWLKEDYFFDVVTKVETSKNKLYDINVTNEHAYWTNGFISHNSSLAYRIAGFAQKLGHPVAWLDTEHSFAENLAIINGVDIDNIYYSTMSNPGDPDKVYFAEDVFDAMLELIKSGVKVIVLDSVANLVTKDRMEAGAEKIIIGKLARLMSENLGKLVAYADKYGCLLLFINQLRYKIGKLFGNPETTPGGMSLKHNSSLIIKITKKNSKEALIEVPGEDGKTKVIGRKSYMRLEKNRFAKPCMDSVEVPIYYTSYFPDVEEIMFEAGRQLKVISVRKGLFKWTDSKDEKHEIEGRSDFVAHIKYNELQYLLAKDLVVAAEENSTILPPEVSKWLNDYELTKKENDEKQPAKKKADGDRKTKSTEAVD